MKKRKDSISLEKIKIPKHEFKVLNKSDFVTFTKYDYTIPQLKMILSNFRLKISGNKKVLVERIEEYLKSNYFSNRIQKLFRGYLVRYFFSLKGGIKLDISNCSNDSDFSTLEKFSQIPKIQYYIYEDEKKFKYIFKLSSLIDYFNKNKFNNPYNRDEFCNKIKNDIYELKQVNKLIDILPKEVEEDYELTKEQDIMIETTEIFQYIDFLGNYSDIYWFLNLSNNRTYRFLKELEDIWNYRAQLSNEMQREIFPPHGKPFYDFHIVDNMNIFEMKKYALKVMRRLVTSSESHDNKSLGALFILSALTLVSSRAAQTMPWLYESVVLM
jgi:hypothetical protein